VRRPDIGVRNVADDSRRAGDDENLAEMTPAAPDSVVRSGLTKTSGVRADIYGERTSKPWAGASAGALVWTMKRRPSFLILLAIALLGWHAPVRAECIGLPQKSGKTPKPARPARALVDPIHISGAFCGKVVTFANIGKVTERDLGEFDLQLFDADGNDVVGTIQVGPNSDFNVSGLAPGRYRLGYIYPGSFASKTQLFKTTLNAVEITRADGAACKQRVVVKLALRLVEECGDVLPSTISPMPPAKK
jgi:hypothetical protein